MNPFYLFYLLIAMLLVSACSKPDPTDPEAGEVDIYLIKSFTESSNSDFIDETTVVLEDDPLLMYSDLLSYNKDTYTFIIKDSKKDIFKLDGNTIHYKAFAVTIDNEVIYTGFFWPSYSSQSINWVVVDPLMAEMRGELIVSLGYPGMLNNVVIPDSRNDSRIVNILKRDNKLID